MLMDQSSVAGEHPLHHVLNVLWEFKPRHLISGMAQPEAGRSRGTRQITGAWAKTLETTEEPNILESS